MTIPTSSNYPAAFDTDQNLFAVNDNLRVRLVEDYNPGDTIIYVEGDMNGFDTTGIITLTDQCNSPELRGTSFYYGLKTATTFEQLQILPEFTDVAKPKYLTDVTQNIMAESHNNLKNAVIAIEEFAGKKGEVGTRPLEGTIEQRTNYLRKLVLQPKAWFTVDKTIGLSPFTVNFTNQSFMLGTDGTSHTVTYLWDFGDNTGPSIITITEDGVVPPDTHNVLVEALGDGSIQKTYQPGVYDVTLTVTNDFGTDSVMFPALINSRFEAPDYAVIEFVQRAGQIVTPGEPTGGPYTTPPVIRAAANTIIDAGISAGINSNTGKTYSGETVDGLGHPIDPVTSYTWSVSDDLPHSNSTSVRSVFSIGGLYDLTLRVDTQFGAYRITTYQNSYDIVESINLWLWNYNEDNTVSAYEFGLTSETFKSKSASTLDLLKDNSFLTGETNETQQKAEFERNNGFIQRGSVSSGDGGVGLLYWASGRTSIASPSTEKIYMSEYNGFTGTYTSRPDISRPWNWVGMGSASNLYFILGGITTSISPNTSPTNQVLNAMSLSSLAVSSTTFDTTNYKNGAEELMNNEVSYDISGDSEQGNMSVYRSAWKDETGYFLRNEGVGNFFRIISFYKTSGNTSNAFQNILKLPDMAGPAKLEGRLIPLSQGIYFFNNSGSVSAYSPSSGVWQTGGAGANSASFQSLQDTSVVGFNDATQPLLAASDGDQKAYLSFDYSTQAFIRFDESATTFSSVTARPAGTQWQMSIF